MSLRKEMGTTQSSSGEGLTDFYYIDDGLQSYFRKNGRPNAEVQNGLLPDYDFGKWELNIKEIKNDEKKRILIGICTVVGLLLLSEIILWSSGRVGLINTANRFISGAPNVEIQGKRLSYQGTIQSSLSNLDEYTSSDEGEALYKAKGTPPNPPWIYVKKDSNTFFRYKIPHVPWRI